MKVQTVSQTGAGSTSPIVINTNVTPVSIGFGIVVSGTVNYTVQYSYDSGLATWFDTTTASKTANDNGSLAIPVAAVRLTVNSGTGTATMSLIQAGIA